MDINAIDFQDDQANIQSNSIPSLQHFYINPQYQDKIINIAPKSNFTIIDAILFQPKSLSNHQLQATILLKNNLTVMYPVPVKGISGSGLIEFVSVYKKSGDQLIKTSTIQNDIFSSLTDNTSQQKSSKERVRDFIQSDNYDKNGSLQTKSKIENQVLDFIINIEDIIIQEEQYMHKMNETKQLDLFSKATITKTGMNQDLQNSLTDKSANGGIKINNIHKRMFMAKNTGDLMVTIENIYMMDRGCQGYGFTIENCQGFQLKPGEHHYIHISYETDFSIARVRKTLVLEGKNFIQTFQVQAQMLPKYLLMAHQHGSLSQFEESTYSTMQHALIFLGAITALLIYRDGIYHFRKSQSQKQEILRKRQTTQVEIDDNKIIQTLVKQQNLILKDTLAHDSIITQYQQAQEKFDHPHQLLFKEITNICSKKNLALLDAQKQAIDAEKEKKQQNKAHQNQHNFDKNEELISLVSGIRDYAQSKVDRKVVNERQTATNESKQTSFQLIEPQALSSNAQKMPENQAQVQQKKKTLSISLNVEQINSSSTKADDKLVKKEDIMSQQSSVQQTSTSATDLQKQVPIVKKPVVRYNKKQRKEELARQKLREQQLQQTIQDQQQISIDKSEDDFQAKGSSSITLEDNQNIDESNLIFDEVITPPKANVKSNQVYRDEISAGKEIEEKLYKNDTVSSNKKVTPKSRKNVESTKKEASNSSWYKKQEEQLQHEKKQLSAQKLPLEQDLSSKFDQSKTKKKDNLKDSFSMSFEVVDSKSNKLSNSIDNISKKSLSTEVKGDEQLLQQPFLDNSIHSYEYNEDNSQNNAGSQNLTKKVSPQSISQQAAQSQQQYNSLSSYYTKKNYKEQQQNSLRGMQQQPYQYKTRGSQNQSSQSNQGNSYYNRGRIGSNQSAINSVSGNTYPTRGASNQAGSYIKRNPMRTNYYNEGDNSYDNGYDYQHLQQPYQPQSSIRKVINTMKPTALPQSRSRGRGNYYKVSSEYEEESADYSGNYGTSGQHSNSNYIKRNKFQDLYEEDSYYNNNQQDYGSNNNRGYIRRGDQRRYQHPSYQQEEFEAEEQDIQFEDVTVLDSHATRNSNKNQQSIDETVHPGDVTYGSFVNELENNQKKSSQKPAPQAKLSKHELAPFFEKQKIDKQEEQAQKLRMSTISPTSSSLFAFQNPQNQLSSTMNVISQRGDSATTVNKEPQEVVKRQIHDLLEEDEESEDEGHEEEKNLGTDFYNAFKSASSLFSKPLFGDKQDERRSKGKKGGSNFINQIQGYGGNKGKSDKESDDGGEAGGSSLFSGSLFGGGSIFGQKKQPFRIGGFDQKQYSETGTLGGVKTLTPYEDEGEIATVDYSSALNELRQGSVPVTDTYSLFGNMNYQHPDSSSNKKSQQFWGGAGKHFQEDEESKSETEENYDQDDEGKIHPQSNSSRNQAKGGYNLFG